jgi:hypothetical protein
MLKKTIHKRFAMVNKTLCGWFSNTLSFNLPTLEQRHHDMYIQIKAANLWCSTYNLYYSNMKWDEQKDVSKINYMKHRYVFIFFSPTIFAKHCVVPTWLCRDNIVILSIAMQYSYHVVIFLIIPHFAHYCLVPQIWMSNLHVDEET